MEGTCRGNCGCHWFRVADANPVFRSTWPREIAPTGRWAVCFRDTCYMHVRYIAERTEKNIQIKYLHHSMPDSAPTMIQSEICARCGDVQRTREFAAPEPNTPPFRFVPCSHIAGQAAASFAKK